MGFENSAGLGVNAHYGPRTTDKTGGGVYTNKLDNDILELEFSYDDLPDENTAFKHLIPANAAILRAELVVLTAFAGGTSYDIGLVQDGGSAIDADGIDAAIALASINAVGARVRCDGALVAAETVDATSASTTEPLIYSQPTIGSNAGSVKVAATGTFTAGKARLVIEYRKL
jgi:hypothetical protein